jgi:hypothetical protein
VAVIIADPHPNVFPKSHEDAPCVLEKAMIAPVQSQKCADPLVRKREGFYEIDEAEPR